ncbi:MAG: tRNA epoxyqueuosine(34) reductase QueG [Anaerolineae bacterium]|nr:tRNA epoxyqueuosine(34) reductase QueG [Anaerolineae bacterium]
MSQTSASRALFQNIQTEAARLGFAWIGLTRPQPPAHYAVYTRWLELGRHGDMTYLAGERGRQLRAQPGLALPGAQAILALGFPYPKPPPAPPADFGRIASYAYGEDYHRFILPKLELLRARISALAGMPINARGYTDTGPFLEREFGMQAGLGWIGKNTCLINPTYGSYLFLAELFIDLELEESSPFKDDRCGTCQRCIQACPMSCILSDRTLDARRCISYLTIENKGVIPPELRARLGNWVFGCDICQIVCPWNRFHHPISAVIFPDHVRFPPLQEEIHLTPAQFNQKYKNSPIQRPRRRGYLRNVAVAIGNSNNPRLIPDLAETLAQEPEPLVRGHCAWALGRFQEPSARAALDKAARHETDPYVRSEILQALESQGSQAGKAASSEME